jgi:predicted phage tail protein
MTKITLHGELGEAIGSEWNLKVKSVSEAISAINILSKRKFYPLLLEKDKQGLKYQIVINNQEFAPNKKIDENTTIQEIKESELCIDRGNLKTIDIVPVYEGSDEVLSIVLGVVLIIVGAIVSIYVAPLGAAIISAGIGLVVGGIIGLLTAPPSFEDFREVEKRGTTSYLFSGPQNTTREGGPVPLGYGRLIVGSQVIQASYDIQDISNTTVNAPKSQQEIDEFE